MIQTSSANKELLFLLTSTRTIPGTELTTGLWIEEYAEPYFRFTELGFSITTVSITGGDVPIDPASWQPDGRRPDIIDQLRASEEARRPLKNAIAIEDIDAGLYAGLYIPGGHGTMWDLAANAAVGALVLAFLESDRPVAAVCHGPAALIGLKDSYGVSVVKNLTVTAFSNAEEEFAGLSERLPFSLQDSLLAAGAIYRHARSFEAHTQVSGKLITGQNPASSTSVVREFVRCLLY